MGMKIAAEVDLPITDNFFSDSSLRFRRAEDEEASYLGNRTICDQLYWSLAGSGRRPCILHSCSIQSNLPDRRAKRDTAHNGLSDHPLQAWGSGDHKCRRLRSDWRRGSYMETVCRPERE